MLPDASTTPHFLPCYRQYNHTHNYPLAPLPFPSDCYPLHFASPPNAPLINRSSSPILIQLLQAAIDTIKKLQYMAGGMVIFLEAENNEKLINFYVKKMVSNDFQPKKSNPEPKIPIH